MARVRRAGPAGYWLVLDVGEVLTFSYFRISSATSSCMAASSTHVLGLCMPRIWLPGSFHIFFHECPMAIISFERLKAFKQWEREGFSMELLVQQHVPGSLPFELLVFWRVIEDGAVGQILDKATHPTRFLVNLLDYLGLLDAWYF